MEDLPVAPAWARCALRRSSADFPASPPVNAVGAILRASSRIPRRPYLFDAGYFSSNSRCDRFHRLHLSGRLLQGRFFATWQFTRSLACPWPACINPLGRLIAQLGAINEFQSAASSYYNGATLSIHRRDARGSYTRLSYTYARAIDDGQDALFSGQPATVENSYNPSAQRGPERHRSAPVTRRHFRRVAPSPAIPTRTATISTTVFRATAAIPLDLRRTKLLRLGERYKINLTAESFNLLNRDNQRVTITSNDLVNNATTFVTNSVVANIAPYPGDYQLPTNFMKPTAAYAPRQVQLSPEIS